MVVASSLSFLVYGIQCLTMRSMEVEFRRYGFGQFRRAIGLAEVLAGIGLLIGLRYPPALRVFSLGLSVLMLGALGVRVKIGDGWYRSLPALVLFVMNVGIFLLSWKS